MIRKEYVKDPNADLSPMPSTAWDYVLSAVVFFLIAVASVPQLASLIVQ